MGSGSSEGGRVLISLCNQKHHLRDAAMPTFNPKFFMCVILTISAIYYWLDLPIGKILEYIAIGTLEQEKVSGPYFLTSLQLCS